MKNILVKGFLIRTSATMQKRAAMALSRIENKLKTTKSNKNKQDFSGTNNNGIMGFAHTFEIKPEITKCPTM